ncbi:MAG TPA: flagellar motor protein [Candidatus Polarisedimenticolia bacterium]|nr:flagellar motor protein [Candidatus Polarisedimenticolia bacterium]
MKRFDIATPLGLIVAVGCILLGNYLEGGHMSAMIQPTAALIVLGGTFGAVLVSYPMPVVLGGIGSIGRLVAGGGPDAKVLLGEILQYAAQARKAGIVSLEKVLPGASDPFLRRAVQLAVDGLDSKTMQATLELELTQMDEHGELYAKVYESAGGYSPTIGILGAVLGLIHVMSNLSDVSKVGEGIAVAFVATIYGVGSANIFFLPAATKLKQAHHSQMVVREMVMFGALAIQEGQNPKLIEDKLSSFLHDKKRSTGAGGKAAARKAA